MIKGPPSRSHLLNGPLPSGSTTPGTKPSMHRAFRRYPGAKPQQCLFIHLSTHSSIRHIEHLCYLRHATKLWEDSKAQKTGGPPGAHSAFDSLSWESFKDPRDVVSLCPEALRAYKTLSAFCTGYVHSAPGFSSPGEFLGAHVEPVSPLRPTQVPPVPSRMILVATWGLQFSSSLAPLVLLLWN